MAKCTCPYCQAGNGAEAPTCHACGAPLGNSDAPVMREKSEPFAYNGYIVWPLNDYARRAIEFYFYLGTELQGIVDVPLERLEQVVPEGENFMPFVWDLFLLGRGELETLVYEAEPFRYTITCTERPVIYGFWQPNWQVEFTKNAYLGAQPCTTKSGAQP